MIVSLIAAIAKNGVIGKDNALPWKLPADMKRFRQLTKGKPVIMGRKTFEAIGKPLPERTNIILTSNRAYRPASCLVAHSVEEALRLADGTQEAMVIGGSLVYEQFVSVAGRMYLTFIDCSFDGDAYFPMFDASEWAVTESCDFEPDAENPYRYRFVTLERIAK